MHCGSLPGLPRAGKSGDAGKADRGIPPAIQRNPLGALHQDYSSGKSDAKRDEQYSKILDKLNDMQADINKALLSIAEFKEKSGKRWDKIVDKILLLVITACVGYILIKFGLPV